MSYTIRPFAPEHAATAAALHAEGQPGTFLTSLGPAFLRALYAEMAVSPHCLGFVAVDGSEVIGVVTGTLDSGSIFKDLIVRRGFKLTLPVLGAVIRHPSLVPKILQTLFYNNRTQSGAGEAEMLYLSARADRRHEGIGKALYWAFTEEVRRRGMIKMGLCVDEANQAAVRFHERQGMHYVHTFTLYGRKMRWYELPLKEDQAS